RIAADLRTVMDADPLINDRLIMTARPAGMCGRLLPSLCPVFFGFYANKSPARMGDETVEEGAAGFELRDAMYAARMSQCLRRLVLDQLPNVRRAASATVGRSRLVSGTPTGRFESGLPASSE